MSLSDAQLTALGNDIRNNTNQTVIDALAAGDIGTILDWYNQAASPDFWMFRTNVGEMEIKEDGIVWSEHVGLSIVELTVFERLTAGGGFDPSQENVRDGLAEIFKGGAQVSTRTNLLDLSSKLASNFEKLYAVDATGTTAGGDGSAQNAATVPGLDQEGNGIERDVTFDEVDRALELVPA